MRTKSFLKLFVASYQSQFRGRSKQLHQGRSDARIADKSKTCCSSESCLRLSSYITNVFWLTLVKIVTARSLVGLAQAAFAASHHFLAALKRARSR
jgi:hypothetical protein